MTMYRLTWDTPQWPGIFWLVPEADVLTKVEALGKLGFTVTVTIEGD
jgi:hypothetical protein